MKIEAKNCDYKSFQGFDLGILMGAFLLELHEKFGIGFMTHPIQALRRLPGSPQNALEAASKVQKAASLAAKSNLDKFSIEPPVSTGG